MDRILRRGGFRKRQNWIGHPGCKIKVKRLLPPPVSDMMVSGSLEKYIHDTRPLAWSGVAISIINSKQFIRSWTVTARSEDF